MFFSVFFFGFVILLSICCMSVDLPPCPSLRLFHHTLDKGTGEQLFWLWPILGRIVLTSQPASPTEWLADRLHGCIQLFFCVCICLLVDGYLFAQNLCIVLSASLSRLALAASLADCCLWLCYDAILNKCSHPFRWTHHQLQSGPSIADSLVW